MKLRFGVAALVLFFCLPVSAFCQLTSANGFIISASGDTLRGRLEYVNSNLSPKRAFIQDGAKTNFIYSGGLGYEFGGFDAGIRYEGYVNDSASTTYFRKTGQYALRLAYNFKL